MTVANFHIDHACILARDQVRSCSSAPRGPFFVFYNIDMAEQDVVCQVVDNVLKEHGASDQVLYNRARVGSSCLLLPKSIHHYIC
jgi:hypothetical protein